MKKFFSVRSYPPLSNLKVLSLEALLLALYLVLGLVTIPLSPTLRVSFSFLAMAISCYFFGFWPNVPFAFAADLLGYLIRPDGPYMPLFALVALVNVMIYSWFFYFQEKITLPRIIMAKGVQVVISNLILNPLILKLMYQTPFWALLSTRLVKNLIEFPVDVILLWFFLRMATSSLQSLKWLQSLRRKGREAA